MRPGKVAMICVGTVIGVTWLSKRSNTVRRVWP